MVDSYSSLPILPLKDTVVFPHIVAPLAVGRARSLAAVQAAADGSRTFLAVAQRDADIDDPTIEQLYPIATLVTISRIEKRKQGAQVIVQGEQRARLLIAGESDAGYLSAHYELLPALTMPTDGPEVPQVDALLRENRQLSERIAMLYDQETASRSTTSWLAALPIRSRRCTGSLPWQTSALRRSRTFSSRTVRCC